MGIPDRWLNYSNSGRISGTRFVAFKVPLEQGCNRSLPPEKRFGSAILLKEFPNIKLIIDLTFTTRYYNQVSNFKNKKVEYVKISCKGREIPSTRVYKKFCEVVDSFLEKNPEDYLIGVHCTHGVNRTGYLIVRYMIERLNYTPESALRAVNVNDPTLRKIAQEINLAEMLLLEYLRKVSSNWRGGPRSAAVDHMSQLVVKELEYLRKLKTSEVVDVTGSFATFRSEDGEFLVTVVPEEELQRNLYPLSCFGNVKPRFAKPVNSRENFAVPSTSTESVYYDACYDLSAVQAPSVTSGVGDSIFGLLSYLFSSTIGKMDSAYGATN